MHQRTVKETAFGARSYFDYNSALQSAEHEWTLINHHILRARSFEVIDSKTKKRGPGL